MDSFQQIDKSDSRHAMKQRDIAATIKKMGAAKEREAAEWDQKMGEAFEEATLETVLKGGVNCVGYTKRYAANFNKVFGNERKKR